MKASSASDVSRPHGFVKAGFSVRFHVHDEEALTAFADKLEPGIRERPVGERIRVALVNPAKAPLESGFEITRGEITGEDVRHVGNGEFVLSINAEVFDVDRLAREAVERYQGCWGHPPEEPLSIHENLYEVLVASNDSPPPADVGFEILRMKPHTWLSQLSLCVVLSHAANPDVSAPGVTSGYWADPVNSGEPMRIEVANLQDASTACRLYIERNSLGGGNWTGGQVLLGDAPIASVSYNGRVWDLAGEEVAPERMQEVLTTTQGWPSAPVTPKAEQRGALPKSDGGEKVTSLEDQLHSAAASVFAPADLLADVTLDGRPMTVGDTEGLQEMNPLASTALAAALDLGTWYSKKSAGTMFEGIAAELRNADADAAADWLLANRERITISAPDKVACSARALQHASALAVQCESQILAVQAVNGTILKAAMKAAKVDDAGCNAVTYVPLALVWELERGLGIADVLRNGWAVPSSGESVEVIFEVTDENPNGDDETPGFAVVTFDAAKIQTLVGLHQHLLAADAEEITRSIEMGWEGGSSQFGTMVVDCMSVVFRDQNPYGQFPYSTPGVEIWDLIERVASAPPDTPVFMSDLAKTRYAASHNQIPAPGM